ncbi:hypothetical protein HWV62_9089 [Athelia sp. TMB]|nr:hypothetical protein HWV62_9089 [Athelia sp. TMB]
MDRVFSGHAQKARINSHDDLADALQRAYTKVKEEFTQTHLEELDREIKASHLPDHLQLLILLSAPPTLSTHTQASLFLDRLNNPLKPSGTLTWAEIVADEPFEGDHWDIQSFGSTPSLSPFGSEDEQENDNDGSLSSHVNTSDGGYESDRMITTEDKREQTYDHHSDVEALQKRQYWREDYVDAVGILARIKHFDLGDVSTLGPGLQRALGDRGLDNDPSLNETTKSIKQSTSTTPRLVHLTLSSQASIISSFAATSTILQRLRAFVSDVYRRISEAPSEQLQAQIHARTRRQTTRTLEAFVDAVDEEICAFDAWCARREEQICRAQAGICEETLVVSLLGLEKAIRDEFSDSFTVIFDVVQAAPDATARTAIASAASTARLLNTLFHAVQERLSMVDLVTSDCLMRIFVTSAEPVWSMVVRWLEHGMPIREVSGVGVAELDDEFFVEDNELPLVDPDFWADGYVLRDGAPADVDTSFVGSPKSVPVFLAHVASDILASGKSTGLLRALGAPPPSKVVLLKQTFRDLLAMHLAQARPTDGHGGSGKSTSLSTDVLSRLVSEELFPHCEATGILLKDILLEECDLWRHLTAIEDLYLMRRGDAMSHFIDLLFSKMDMQQQWNDFHFLNSAFGNIVEAGHMKWIEGSLVRFSYRGRKDQSFNINRTIKAIDGLLVEYAVPFPLTYLFGPQALKAYGSLFVFLLQIRRAKSVLERILVRGEIISSRQNLNGEFKVFYAMRSKLSWFINTLLNFLTTYVLHTQILTFHERFHKATSLDEMIQTSALHRAILSVLDMCLHFSEYFMSFAGDTTTHDISISRQSTSYRRHRSRRQRKQRRNTIGFSRPEPMSEESDTDEEEELGGQDINASEPSISMGAYGSVGDDTNDSVVRLDKMSSELDGLVRFIRRGTESLAGGVGEAAPAFEVLAFALEDWDS